ncbi:Golgi phosphoprotein 3 [Atractiella rhizophila]|nr:Golgi phosphoprotein 3 [Atractiella rhizophila]
MTTTNSQLSRRRGPKKEEGAGPSTSGPPSPALNGDTLSEEAGHKVAYDPKEFAERQGEDRLNPKLTIMEEVLLLGLKDRQGYLSFWNDNISYALRGCILLELALRHRIAMVRDPNRRRWSVSERFIEVVDERNTGEVLLDEALKMMKVSEKMSVGTWIDLMSGETWNVMKIGYQLKQVRERLAKGLVDKGVLRTEKKNFLLFDMATHPVSDPTFKEEVLRRSNAILASRTTALPVSSLYPDGVRYRTVRAVSMVCAAYAANVLENGMASYSYEERERALGKCDDLMVELGNWPFGRSSGSGSSNGSAAGLGTGSRGDNTNASLNEILRLCKEEVAQAEGKELHLEVVAGVLQVFGKMDSLL